MYVVVLGAGRIGSALARWLVSYEHEVVVIERDVARAAALEEELGNLTVVGDGTEAGVLYEAGISRADVFVAATGRDGDNLVACQMAKHHFAVAKTVALVNIPEHDRLFRTLGIDVTINVSDLLVTRIQAELSIPGLVRLLPVPGRGRRSLVGIRVPEGSDLVGRAIKDLALPDGVTIPLVITREGRVTVPDENTRIQAEDEVLAITTAQQEDELRDLLAGASRQEE